MDHFLIIICEIVFNSCISTNENVDISRNSRKIMKMDRNCLELYYDEETFMKSRRIPQNFKVSTICLCNQTEFSSVVIGMVRISQLPSVVLKKKETCLCDNRRKRYFPFFNILTEILYYAPWVLERYLFFCPFIISLFLFFYFSILGVVR